MSAVVASRFWTLIACSLIRVHCYRPIWLFIGICLDTWLKNLTQMSTAKRWPFLHDGKPPTPSRFNPYITQLLAYSDPERNSQVSESCFYCAYGISRDDNSHSLLEARDLMCRCVDTKSVKFLEAALVSRQWLTSHSLGTNDIPLSVVTWFLSASIIRSGGGLCFLSRVFFWVREFHVDAESREGVEAERAGFTSTHAKPSHLATANGAWKWRLCCTRLP